jgi:hypothetical protein
MRIPASARSVHIPTVVKLAGEDALFARPDELSNPATDEWELDHLYFHVPSRVDRRNRAVKGFLRISDRRD